MRGCAGRKGNGNRNYFFIKRVTVFLLKGAVLLYAVNVNNIKKKTMFGIVKFYKLYSCQRLISEIGRQSSIA